MQSNQVTNQASELFLEESTDKLINMLRSIDPKAIDEIRRLRGVPHFMVNIAIAILTLLRYNSKNWDAFARELEDATRLINKLSEVSIDRIDVHTIREVQEVFNPILGVADRSLFGRWITEFIGCWEEYQKLLK